VNQWLKFNNSPLRDYATLKGLCHARDGQTAALLTDLSVNQWLKFNNSPLRDYATLNGLCHARDDQTAAPLTALSVNQWLKFNSSPLRDNATLKGLCQEIMDLACTCPYFNLCVNIAELKKGNNQYRVQISVETTLAIDHLTRRKFGAR
jgi:hypothetical protein